MSRVTAIACLPLMITPVLSAVNHYRDKKAITYKACATKTFELAGERG